MDGVFLLDFPSYEEAVAWYRSPAYQAESDHRLRGPDHGYIIFDGLDRPAVHAA
jgi:uncharacterized protein (DUF1330 family)